VTVSENESIRVEMSALRSDLSGAITAGLTAVNATIQTLAKQHHQAVLDQAKLNPTFAPRDRVDLLSARVEDNAKRISAIENQHLELKTQLTAISAQLTAMSLQLAALTDRTLDKDHLEWVKHTRQRSMDHAATRVQFAKQLLGYLMIAVAGIIISGIGLGHLITILLGGH
jgi:chromosome segregation ATPase